MKKTIFTICSITLVCCAIIMSCAKDDNSALHVGYASQSGYGGGHNPNPNGLPYTTVTPSTTTTNTTVTTNTTTTNFTVDGTSATNPSTSGTVQGGNFVVLGIASAGYPQLQITFPGASAPTSGSYVITSGTPTGNQCGFVLTTSGSSVSSASSGSVTVTAAASPGNTATFSGIVCTGSGNHIVSGTIKY